MLTFFEPIKEFLKYDEVRIDNTIFWLHYKATSLFLASCVLMVASKQYIGDPIDCEHKEAVSTSLMDTYCWVHSGYVVQETLNSSNHAHEGVSNYVIGEHTKINSSYYQFVCLVLAFQVLAFYIPKFIWNRCEGGLVKTLCSGLDSPIIPEETLNEKLQSVSNYLREHRGSHQRYYMTFVLCEILNFVNVIAQMFLLDVFFNNMFWSYGGRYVSYMAAESTSGLVDPRTALFPTMSICDYFYTGTSGRINSVHSVCILPINVLNEKVAIAQWFWFTILTIITLAALIYRIAITLMAGVRGRILQAIYGQRDDSVAQFSYDQPVGDWFLLFKLHKNVDHSAFQTLINSLTEREYAYSGKD